MKWLAILAVVLVATACCVVQPPSAEAKPVAPTPEVVKPETVQTIAEVRPPAPERAVTVTPCGYDRHGRPRF